jgi:predicted secreted protein
MAASDGGVFAFGPGATYYGSMGGKPLAKPVVAMAATTNNYYLVAADGGVFAFGPGATYYGSMGGKPLAKPVVAMAATTNGYYMAGSDGGVFAFGPGATYYGSMGGTTLAKPVVAMAPAPAASSTSNGAVTLKVQESATSVPADGSAPVTYTATATNSSGQPETGDVLTATTSGSPAGACGTLTPPTTQQPASGSATFAYTASTTVGTCTVTISESAAHLSVSLALQQTAVTVLTAANNGQQVAAHVGDEFEIELTECASCGYQWQAIAPTWDAGVLDYQGTTTRSQTSGGQVGGNVTRVFSFEAVGTGSTTVHLGYFPPGSSTASQTWSATFVVS